jgi:hypothetical protein
VADASVCAIISSKFRDVDIIIKERQDSRGAVAVADEDLLCSTCCCGLGGKTSCWIHPSPARTYQGH